MSSINDLDTTTSAHSRAGNDSCRMQIGLLAGNDCGPSRMTVTSRGLYAYLTILTGNRAGTNFPLDARRKTLIGRGTDCHISLPDPLCSRVHATLTCTPDGWVIRDAESRNGTHGQRPEDRRSDASSTATRSASARTSSSFTSRKSRRPPRATIRS